MANERDEGFQRPTGEGRECPQCGEPMDDVRKTCLKCGYEFSQEDYENPEAGTEFRAGSAVDEEGSEVPEWDPDSGQGARSEDDEQT